MRQGNFSLLSAEALATAAVVEAYLQCEEILRSRGWKFTSDTPNCYWLWQKKLKDGRTVLVSRHLAIQFEIIESGEQWPATHGNCHDDES